MNNILNDPDRIFDYARLYTVSVAGSLIWGHRATSLESFWYKDFYELMDLVLPFPHICFVRTTEI